MRRRVTTAIVVLPLLASAVAGAGAAATSPVKAHRLTFTAPQRLAGAAGGTEPQLATGPDGVRYAITGANVTGNSGQIRIYRSSARGDAWTPTAGQMVGVRVAGPDVDIAASSTGRLVALEEDSAALSLVVNYSDDGGRSWHASSGVTELADQDRPWLAAGPRNTVYLLFHNGFSSNATHNMFVETSSDGGASFGAPVPLTLPGSAAWSDLQCADSGGPSALLANRRSGRLYAVWGTRHGPAGGCGVQPLEPFTLVPADRVWVATSATGAPGSWTTHLAVDGSATGRVVGMQLSPAALDSAGNLWLAWTTPPRGFPDDSGAGISIREANPSLSHWSKPRTLVGTGGAGRLLVQLVAGTPGRLGLLYLRGVTTGGTTRWYPTAGIVTHAMTGTASFTTDLLSQLPSYRGTATALMGSGCDPSTTPQATVADNPVTCPRSADVIGITLDRSCRLTVTWPSLAAATNAVLGVSVDATWVATQTGGPKLCLPSS